MSDERDDIRRREEATAWFVKMSQRRVSSEDVRAFTTWRRDPENARVFKRVETVWEAHGQLDEDPAVQALVEGARARTAPRRRAEPRNRFGILPVGAGMAMIALACAIGVAFLFGPERFETSAGEQRTVRLEDGSRIILDTRTRIAVRMSGSERRIVLAEGQAYFDVARDARRPFIVQAGDTSVTAVGTRFDVRRVQSGAYVVLAHGRVNVSQDRGVRRRWSLDPGESISTTQANPTVSSVDVDRALSWTSGRLIFDRTPVATAVAEMNRYSDRAIVLTDAAVGADRISGAFDAGDSDAFAAALIDLYPLDETRTGERITLSRQRGASD